ncbi:MAG: SDR family oxidoreductase, partial [Firmicutes bacterium]|nr:SDR family oxidoreductase [Bacillota bacterium]
MLLQGKLSIVTGGGGGFGREISLTLARSGSTVAVVDINESQAAEVAKQIRAEGGQAEPFKVDITNIQEVKGFIERLVEKFQKIDILINNAGATLGKPAVEVIEEDWYRVMDINLKGTFFMAQAAGREMIVGGGGNIVNIASISGLVAEINTSVYSTSKTGVIAITRNLA